MFYAVAKGKNPGIYKSWNECQNQVKGFKGAKFQKFKLKKTPPILSEMSIHI